MALVGEQDDFTTERVWGVTSVVTTDSSGKAQLNLNSQFTGGIEAATVTRVTSNGVVGQVVIDADTTDIDTLGLIFKGANGSTEANVQRKVSVVVLGFDEAPPQ